jgi:hypothetical protein
VSTRDDEPILDLVRIEAVLRASHGFLVDDEDAIEVGVVDDVFVDEHGHVLAIVVCGGWFGRRRWTFDVGDVVAVSPALRRIVVENESTRRKLEERRKR